MMRFGTIKSFLRNAMNRPIEGPTTKTLCEVLPELTRHHWLLAKEIEIRVIATSSIQMNSNVR